MDGSLFVKNAEEIAAWCVRTGGKRFRIDRVWRFPRSRGFGFDRWKQLVVGGLHGSFFGLWEQISHPARLCNEQSFEINLEKQPSNPGRVSCQLSPTSLRSAELLYPIATLAGIMFSEFFAEFSAAILMNNFLGARGLIGHRALPQLRQGGG